jgi:hypothetical protein
MHRQTRMMSPQSIAPPRRPKTAAAHLAIAVLATTGAMFIQVAWGADFDPITSSSWRLPAALAIVFATVWLVWTAWLHAKIARSPGESWMSKRRMISRAAVNLLVAAVAGAILLQGHRSPFAVAGLWVVSPTLLAVGVPSGVALLMNAAGR